MKIAVLFANGTEEIEALTPVDVIRRAGVQCDIVSVNGEFPQGSHGIVVKADKTSNNVCFDEYHAIVVPGGMPGAVNIKEDEFVSMALRKAVREGKLVAAICASPAVVLASNGIVDGKKVTCYPADSFIEMLKNSDYTASDVEVDGNIITANGPKSAMKFALAICEYLNLTPKF